MISIQKLLDRTAAGEDEHTEFKSHFTRADAVLPSIIALANGSTEGWIIFGVNDEGDIVGVLGAEELKQRLISLCRQQCEPPLTPVAEVIMIDDGAVVVLRVEGDHRQKPYRQKKRNVYWLRLGNQNQLVTREEIECFLEEQHRVWFPLLQELTVKHFRSLYDVRLSLKPLNIIIGRNASGKSNLFKLLRFVRDIVVEGDWKRYDEVSDHLLWYGVEDTGTRPDRFAIDLTLELSEQLGRFPPIYHLVAQPALGKINLVEESLRLKLAAADDKPVEFIKRRGEDVQRYVERRNSDYVAEGTRLSRRTAALREYGRDATFPPVAAFYHFIEGWRFFDVDAQAARQRAISSEQPVGVPALASDASNLSAFLHALSCLDSDLFDEIQDRLGRAIDFLEAVEPQHLPSLLGGQGEVSLAFRERTFPDLLVPPESLSDGTIRLLAHLAAILGDPAATLICIEEPNHGLHPHLMLRLADALRSVVDVEPDDQSAELERPQVILTTHSPDFLDCFDLETEANYLQVFVAERDLANGKTTFRPVSAMELAHWLDEYRLGELVRMGVVR